MITEDLLIRLVERQRLVIEGQRAEIVRLTMKVYEAQKILGDRTSPPLIIERATHHA